MSGGHRIGTVPEMMCQANTRSTYTADNTIAALIASLRAWLFTVACAVAAVILTACAATAQQRPPPFWPEIRAFLMRDDADGIKPCRTVFVGSSSIRLWQDLARDLGGLPVVRRGFGGAHLDHVSLYFEVLVTRHRPRAIVLYAGENDISAGRQPERVLASLMRLLAIKRRAVGTAPVYYIAIKPSLSRWHEFARQSRANTLIKQFAAASDDLIFVDVAGAMLIDGRPKPIFLSDGLHMNRAGYKIWARLVRQSLATSGATVPEHCRSRGQ